MEITFLGTGDAFGSGGRHAASILVRGDDFGLLLDCGASILPNMKHLGISPDSIDAVLISHHHGDHFCGVPFLLLEYQYRSPNRGPLTLAGPPRTEDVVSRLTRLLFPGLDAKPRPYELAFRELSAETTLLGSAQVTPFRVRHFPDAVAYGFRIEMAGKTVVYSGDTEWTDELAHHSDGADLLICECTTFESKVEFHMSHAQLLGHRNRIRASRTILLHAGEDVLSRRNELAFELAQDGQVVNL
jgi:ribonuclease BN (tRNA processing enzyme)